MSRIPLIIIAALIVLPLATKPAASTHKPTHGGGGANITLGDLKCTAGQVAMFDGSAWVCADLFVPKVVFITSDSYTGNMGGIIGADAICQNLADLAGVAGIFRAWLSDSTGVSPASRFVRSLGPYVRTDGEVIANNWADLTDGEIAVPINIDENGFSPPTFRSDASPWHTWSATRPDGTPWHSSWPAAPPQGEYCEDWTIEVDTTPEGGIGYLTRTDGVWTECITGDADCDGLRNGVIFGETRSCDNPMRLYCFEQ